MFVILTQNIWQQELFLLETCVEEEEHLDNFSHSDVICQVANSTKPLQALENKTEIVADLGAEHKFISLYFSISWEASILEKALLLQGVL